MTRIFKYLFITCLVPVLISAQECKSTLEFKSSDSEACVWLNGVDLGKLPQRISVEKGTYIVVVKESLRKWDPQIITDTLRVDDCGIFMTRSYNFKKEIILDSSPQNASVVENGNVIGYTPVAFLANLPAVTLEKRNYESVELHGLAELKNPVEMKFTGIKSDGDFFESGLFKVLMGSAVALGATAAYFKIQADKKYDEYLRSKNASLLDDVDSMDLYSGIAFGLLQVNFGYLIYKFLGN